MELWTGALSWWKCHWPDLKSVGFFSRNLFLNSLKPQHSNPNHNPLANKLWCIDLLTLPTPLTIPNRLSAFLESLMPLKNWCSIYARCSKSSLKHSIRFCDIFPSLKQNFIAYRSSKVSSCSDCIFEIHQLWQSSFSSVYSNCYCRNSIEPEIIKIGQSSHKMYSNKIVNFQESTIILNTYRKKVWKLIECTRYKNRSRGRGQYVLMSMRIFPWDGSGIAEMKTFFTQKPPRSPDLSAYDLFL